MALVASLSWAFFAARIVEANDALNGKVETSFGEYGARKQRLQRTRMTRPSSTVVSICTGLHQPGIIDIYIF